MKASIIRGLHSNEGTFGTFSIGSFFCYTAELPWLGNARRISSIPTGKYLCKHWMYKGKYDAYKLQDVADRSDIIIHQGNFAGNSSLGYKTNVLGCILVGKSVGIISNQRALISSLVTLKSLVAYTNKQPFTLEIV